MSRNEHECAAFREEGVRETGRMGAFTHSRIGFKDPSLVPVAAI